MFKSNKNATDALNGKKYSTTIYAEFRLSGEVKFSGDTYFDGKMKGNINASPNKGNNDILVIGPNANIVGNIVARDIYILGKIEGNVYSEGIVFLLPDSLVQGDIHYSSVEMKHGAKVNGRFHHLSSKEASDSVVAQVVDKK